MYHSPSKGFTTPRYALVTCLLLHAIGRCLHPHSTLTSTVQCCKCKGRACSSTDRRQGMEGLLHPSSATSLCTHACQRWARSPWVHKAIGATLITPSNRALAVYLIDVLEEGGRLCRWRSVAVWVQSLSAGSTGVPLIARVRVVPASRAPSEAIRVGYHRSCIWIVLRLLRGGG